MRSTSQPHSHPRWTFVAASLPGWIVAVVAAVLLQRTTPLPLWGAILLAAVWIGTDIATFPRRRRFYTPDPAQRRIVGERGLAASDLLPRGFVRVHGELWQARLEDAQRQVREGEEVEVRDIEGLELTVAGTSRSVSSI